MWPFFQWFWQFLPYLRGYVALYYTSSILKWQDFWFSGLFSLQNRKPVIPMSEKIVTKVNSISIWQKYLHQTFTDYVSSNRHARCDCNLWSVLWFLAVFIIYCQLCMSKVPNFHRLCVLLIKHSDILQC